MKTPNKIPTKMRIIFPEGKTEEWQVELDKEPGYTTLNELITPILTKFNAVPNCNFEHVSVWADFLGGTSYKALDMFVDDIGLIRGLKMNPDATVIYRQATLMGKTGAPKTTPPEQLSFICGVAILFERRVWF